MAPSQDVLTIAFGKAGDRRAIPMRRGLIPASSKEGKQKGAKRPAAILGGEEVIEVPRTH
jgi:hypothetical protein